MVTVAPSLLAADFKCLQEQVQMVEQSGADWLHLDIMDGHFVPNLSFGPDVIRQLRPISRLFFDAHLMVENPYQFLPMFLNSGAEQITVHLEACADLSAVLACIKEHKIKRGISIKPQTSAEALIPFLDEVDNILVMTVEPGFGGQKFMETQLEKIAKIKQMIAGHHITLEVDGGINAETAVKCVKNGADVLVAGSAIFKADNLEKIINFMKQLGE